MRTELVLAALLAAASSAGWAQQSAANLCAARERASFDVVSVHVMAQAGSRSSMRTREDSYDSTRRHGKEIACDWLQCAGLSDLRPAQYGARMTARRRDGFDDVGAYLNHSPDRRPVWVFSFCR